MNSVKLMDERRTKRRFENAECFSSAPPPILCHLPWPNEEHDTTETREFIDGTIQGTSADHLVNLGHIFAEHLVSLKRKAFTGTCAKESVGSLLTQIFRHPGIRLVQTTVKRDMYFMDETQLTSVQWLKDGRLGFFIDEIGPHLIELPNRKATNFDGCRSRLEFHPDLLFILNPPVRLRRQAGTHAAAAPAEDSDPLAAPAALFPPTAPFPDFPHIPEIPILDHGDFQRNLVDAL
ncbi:hypothetical protein F2Q68_00016228 [Brassica cretica]|uniref:Uncharacterized protein n=1 Tax=Brassica cretica TaxID=69181 RepID=A0A8S9HH44_BRACR|nr:hypothetical protein F2Q68_00016228 [Brassica cretica]